MQLTNLKNSSWIILLAIVLFFTILLSIGIGSKNISVSKITDIFSSSIVNSIKGEAIEKDPTEIIIFKLRMPRIFLAVVVGGILALSGLVYQTLLKNPLAEPFTLGISSGASFGVALSIFLSDSIIGHRLPVFPFALIGGSISIAIILLISLNKNISIFTLLFTGICISFFFNAFLTLFLSLLGNRSYEVLSWAFGTLSNSPGYLSIIILSFFLIIFFIFLMFMNHQLDAFYLSEDVTKSLGINTTLTRGILFLFASLLTIITVSLCGIIGFVGLIVPHIARLIFGQKHKILIPACILLGALLLLISDDIARTIVSVFTSYGKELPIGVITSLIGAPFFLYFLLKYKDSI